jgi:phosphoenolpyruvate carboxylase
MSEYATLVSDPALRERLFAIITEEFEKTRLLLTKIFGGSVESRRPRMARTLRLRADALKILHRQQIGLLRTWRAALALDTSAAEKLLPKVLLSVNAIASGLRTTG